MNFRTLLLFVCLFASQALSFGQLVTRLSDFVSPAPLDFAVGYDGSIQIWRGGAAQLYNPSQAPINYSIYNSIMLTLGTPEIAATSGFFNYADHQWDNIGVSGVIGAGTAALPWRITATMSSSTYPDVQLITAFKYVNGNDFIDVEITPSVPITNTNVVKLYHVIDTYLNGSDTGPAYVLGAAPHTFVGTESTAGGLWEGFVVGNTAWDHFESRAFNLVLGQPNLGADLTNALDYSSSTDNGIGVQWTLGVVTGTQPTITYKLSFTNSPPVLVEVCGNGIDDDGNGDIDCADAACAGDIVCNDSDMDGLIDTYDFDDDNDGILDSDECQGATGPELILNGSMNSTTATGSAKAPDNWSLVPFGVAYSVSTSNSASTADIWDATTYPSWTSTPTASPDGGTFANGVAGDLVYDYFDEGIEQTLFGLDPTAVYQVSFYQTTIQQGAVHTGAGQWRVYYNEILIGTSTLVPNTGSGSTVWSTELVQFVPPIANGKLSFMPQNDGVAPVRMLIDGISLREVSCDFDADGVLNVFDRDSDNDGIFDCVEGGSGQPFAAGELTGGIDDDGIPLSVSTGTGTVNYTYLNSNVLGAIDCYELDSDGDGCPDVLEAGYDDPDKDGRLGPAPLTTNPNTGLVTSGGP